MKFLTRFVFRVVLFGAIYGLLSCAHAPRITAIQDLTAASFKTEQRDRAVAITIECRSKSGIMFTARGSGVIVDQRRVITAKHVITCPKGFFTLWIAAETRDGKASFLSVEKLGEGKADTARLTTLFGSEFLSYDPVRYGEAPSDDDVVCVSAALPERWRRCGVVDVVMGERVYSSYAAYPGNSGSGAYNVKGELVGVATHYMRCGTPGSCGSIIDLRIRWWDMPDK